MAEKKDTKELIEEYNSLPPDDETKAIIGQELKARGIIAPDADGLLPPQIDLKAQREEDKPITAPAKEYLRPISASLKEYLGMLDEEEPVVEEPVEEQAAIPDSPRVRQMTLQNYEPPTTGRVSQDIIYFDEMFGDNFAQIPGMERVEGRPTPLLAVISQEQGFSTDAAEKRYMPRQATENDYKRARDAGLSRNLLMPHPNWDKSADEDVEIGQATGTARGLFQTEPDATKDAITYLIKNPNLANGIFEEAKEKLSAEDYHTLELIQKEVSAAREAANALQGKERLDKRAEEADRIEDLLTELFSTGYYPHANVIIELAYIASSQKKRNAYQALQQRGGTTYKNINDIQESKAKKPEDEKAVEARAKAYVEKYMKLGSEVLDTGLEQE
jgi:predicted nucleic acid-binding protein